MHCLTKMMQINTWYPGEWDRLAGSQGIDLPKDTVAGRAFTIRSIFWGINKGDYS